jgi:phage tail-like protein
MATGDRNDPYHVFNFRVEIDNTAVAGFREAGGLNFNVEIVDYREGSDIPLHTRKLTGLRRFANLTLRRGFTTSRELWNWYSNILNGVPDRRNGAVVLQDELHNDVLRWEFTGGLIARWEGPAMNATTNEVAIEAIEIAVERVELAAA